MVTKAQLKEQLKELGLKSTDTVLVHTSLRAVGPVENGADGLIDAFCEYLNEGLFLVPTHTWGSIGPQQPVYDVRTEVPCIGTLPKVAAFRADGIRSLNPTHSVWAHGSRAAEFVQGEETVCSGTHPDSCWGRLLQENAKILLIGVGNERNTYIHSLDERFGVPDRLTEKTFETTMIDAHGNRYYGRMHQHHCSRCVDVSQNFVNFEKPFVTLGVQTFGTLGQAQVRVVDVAKCTAVVEKLWQKAEYDLCVEKREIPEAYYL